MNAAAASGAPMRCPGCGAIPPIRRPGGRDLRWGTPGVFDVRWCDPCGLGVTDPRPEPLSARYPPGYHGDAASDEDPAFAPTLARVLSRLAPGAAFDVGAGRGEFLAALASKGWRVRGIEPVASAAVAARERGIEVATGTLAECGNPDGVFDLVTILQVLEHLPDPRAALRILRPLLRPPSKGDPGGALVVSVPDAGSIEARLAGADWFHLDLPRHLVHFSTRGLLRLLAEEGFTVESTHGDLTRHAVAGAGEAWDRLRGHAPRSRLGWSVRAAFARGVAFLGRIVSPSLVEVWARRTE